MESGQYLSYIGSDQRARYVSNHGNMLVMSDVVQAHLNVCKHTILWHAQTHISTQWFRSDKSQYLWRTLWSFLNTQHDQSTQTSMQACYFLVYMGPYYCHIWLDLWYKGVYGIRGACWSCLSTYDPSTQSSLHAHYVLEHKGQYLSQIGSDQRDQGMSGIRGTCQSYLST